MYNMSAGELKHLCVSIQSSPFTLFLTFLITPLLSFHSFSNVLENTVTDSFSTLITKNSFTIYNFLLNTAIYTLIYIRNYFSTEMY